MQQPFSSRLRPGSVRHRAIPAVVFLIAARYLLKVHENGIK